MTRAHPGTPVWNQKNPPRRSSKALARFYNLNIHERTVAHEAAQAVERYRNNPPMGTGENYEGDTAEDVVGRQLPDASPRRQAAVMDVALAIAEEMDVDLSSRRDAGDYRKSA